MHIEYINKEIILDNNINEINLINIEDSIEYLNRNDGILIKGKIDIECEYISLGVVKYFKDNVDISILVAYENIVTNELFFKLEDFDYYIKNNIINFSFKINIEGYKEIEKSFQDENQEMEIVSNVDVDEKKIKEILFKENINDEIIELDKKKVINSELIIEENINQINNTDDTVSNEGIRLDFNIDGEEAIEYIDTNIKVENIDNNKLFNNLFKKDKKIKLYKYRVVLENDTYEDIAKENNINLFKLKELNNNEILKIGHMIKIPSKNE